jgi:hypothetical protein
MLFWRCGPGVAMEVERIPHRFRPVETAKQPPTHRTASDCRRERLNAMQRQP